MFGLVTPNLSHLTADDKRTYQQFYCGLCHSLRDKHNNFCRLALTYDMTFLAILLSSLNEPENKYEHCNCVFHPGQRYDAIQNEATEFTADMTVIFAYHKLLDDVNDDNSTLAKIGSKILEKNYKNVAVKYPDFSKFVEGSMQKITELEANGAPEAGDEISKIFGNLMAQMFAEKAMIAKQFMAEFGFYLGQFIYFMDTAIDLGDDLREGKFNPLLALDFAKNLRATDFVTTKEHFDDINKNVTVYRDSKIYKDLKATLTDFLRNFAGKAVKAFEKLPLEAHASILENIIFEGMWASFNLKFKTPANALE